MPAVARAAAILRALGNGGTDASLTHLAREIGRLHHRPKERGSCAGVPLDQLRRQHKIQCFTVALIDAAGGEVTVGE